MKKVRFSKEGQKSKWLRREYHVVTYHTTLLNKLTFIIYKNLYLLYMNQEVKNVFTVGPILPFRSAMKISSYLVSAKLCPLERTVSFKNCDKSRFEDCLNIEEADTFTTDLSPHI